MGYPSKSDGYTVEFRGGPITKDFRIWANIMSRCYAESSLKKRPTYEGCTVDKRWLSFETFKSWLRDNYREGFELDKDLLEPGNRVYGPDTCEYIPPDLNKLFGSNRNKLSGMPTGVCRCERGRFRARLTRFGRITYVGKFKSVEEARKAWLVAKGLYCKELAEMYKASGSISNRMHSALLLRADKLIQEGKD